MGRKFLIGSIWMSILRYPKCRGAGIKYLNMKIPKMIVDDDDIDDSDEYSEDEEEKKKEENEEII